ncbi:MAG: hypothetical protein RLZZ63_69 [Gemmatimonadota bacterium]|jgi:hypothetical protein
MSRLSRRVTRWSGVALVALITAGSTPLRAQLPSGVKAGPWIDLLAGGAAPHWRTYRDSSLESGWRYDATTRILRREQGKDIVTTRQFGDFELELAWKVGPKGNSGIFYRASEATGVIYENAPEMQILDNAGHRDGGSPLTSAGANYALHAPPSDVSKPAGQWNVARIVAVGAHVEHWLNGVKLLEYEQGSPEWQALVAKSKFAAWPAYGQAMRGHIGLQDHGDVVEFKNIRIRELAR